MRDIKWGDKEALTEKVRLESRLETVRMLAKRIHREEHSRQRDRAKALEQEYVWHVQ